MLFQILDRIADGRAGELQLLGRLREAAEMGDAREDAHCLQMIHAGENLGGDEDSLHC